MNTEDDRPSRRYERFAVGAALLILAIGCYLIVRPFLTAFIWGAIISLSTRGIYRRILGWVGGRRSVAATLCSLGLVLVLLIPISALAFNLAAQMPDLTARFKQLLDGGLQKPPDWLAGVPLIGKVATAKWQAFAADPELLKRELRPFLGPIKDLLVTAVGGVGVGLLQ